MFIFLDESGNFKGSKDGCFVVGGFITDDPKRTGKSFRKWQHKKFPKKIRYKTEVKFSDTGLDEKLRLKTLEYFTRQDLRVFYAFLRKRNIPLRYRQEGDIKSGFLYTEIVAQTLGLLLPTPDTEFRVFRDQRHLKKVSQSEFNQKIKLDISPSLPSNALVQIRSIDSTTNTNIQIADWVCGALYRYYSKGKNGQNYFSILKNSIIDSRELFKDYWSNFHKNKKSPQQR